MDIELTPALPPGPTGLNDGNKIGPGTAPQNRNMLLGPLPKFSAKVC